MTIFKICTFILFYFLSRAAINMDNTHKKETIKINSLIAEVR